MKFLILLLLASCSTGSHSMKSNSQYPDHWFAAVNDPHPPAWEILPQAAKPGEVILSKRNELGILSNFAHTPFTFRGQLYESIEGLWQMMLYPEDNKDPRLDPRVKWKYTRTQVSQMVGFQAKLAGELAEKNMHTLGIDWVSFNGEHFKYRSMTRGLHYELIHEAMTQKLKQNPEVQKVLASTGSLILRPDHHEEQNAPPEWRYFEIWMELRAQSDSIAPPLNSN